MNRSIAAGLVLLAAVACTDSSAPPLEPSEAAFARGQQKPKLEAVFNTQLRGEFERPAATDSEAKGHAQIKIYSNGLIEWKGRINNKENEPFHMGHIHRISNLENRTGGIVLWLMPPGGLAPSQTVATLPNQTDRHIDFSGSELNPVLAAAILAEPHMYYVNFHTRQYPGGAILGDLE